MTSRRRALIVATSVYDDPDLSPLMSPAADVNALAEVLSRQDIGDFQVEVVEDQLHHVVQARIDDFFSESAPDDLLLVHFSGHGVKAETGELFLAARDTRPKRLGSTAVPAEFVQRCMRMTPSRRVVLFLDCCYGGAFPQGAQVRAAGPVDVLASFPGSPGLPQGRGRAVITASTAMEYAFEGVTLTGGPSQPSLFTSALVEGLSSGEADRDGDGWVSLDELYEYVFDKVRLANPAQTPSRQFDLRGEIHIARSSRLVVRPAQLPDGLQRAAQDPDNLYARLGAIEDLAHLLTSSELGIAAAAHAALRNLADRDVRVVSEKATRTLAVHTIRPNPSTLTMPVGTPGTDSQHVINLDGVPLAQAVTATSSSPSVRARALLGRVELDVRWPLSGDETVTLDGPLGNVVVPIRPAPTPSPTEVVVSKRSTTRSNDTPPDPDPWVQPPQARPFSTALLVAVIAFLTVLLFIGIALCPIAWFLARAEKRAVAQGLWPPESRRWAVAAQVVAVFTFICGAAYVARLIWLYA